MLTLVTWVGILALSGIYHAVFGMEEYNLFVAIKWLFKFLLGSILMFLTVSPFAYIAQKTKGFVAPVIASAVIVMGSAALCNQDFGALYPWTTTFFLAVPVMFGLSAIKILKFGFSFTSTELLILGIGMAVAFTVSVLVIKFLMGYIKKHDFKAFGWYRIVLGAIVILYFTVLS